jgi:FixJ family two-component response regulator
MEGGFVLYVEDDEDLREVFKEVVIKVLERRCVAVASYEELVALSEEALACGVAVLDVNLGPNRRSGIDAYNWLRHMGYAGPIVFLTGHASSHPLVLKATRVGDARLLSKPIDLDDLRSVIEGKRQ